MRAFADSLAAIMRNTQPLRDVFASAHSLHAALVPPPLPPCPAERDPEKLLAAILTPRRERPAIVVNVHLHSEPQEQEL